ncbi:MAG: HD domain-containing protein, partial [Clostridia bacterium]|nr:HD domain-containing protein [Clostridia bacterium]
YYSQRILERVEGFGHIANWIGTHHETLDGHGYPFQLQEREIELCSRILAVADIFSALVEDRPYRAGMNPQAALAVLREMASHHKIDTRLVEDVADNLDILAGQVSKFRT